MKPSAKLNIKSVTASIMALAMAVSVTSTSAFAAETDSTKTTAYKAGTYTITANLYVPGELNTTLPGVTAYLTNPNNPLGIAEDNGEIQKVIPNQPVSDNASLEVDEDGNTTLTLPVKNPVFTLQQIGDAENATITGKEKNNIQYSSMSGTAVHNGRITKLIIDLKDNSGIYKFTDCVEFPTLLGVEWTVPLTMSVDFSKVPTKPAEEPLKNTSSINKNEITLGTKITLNASAEGGTAPYKYKYYCKPQGDKSWTALTGTTTATSLTKTPARAINYQYAVKIADSKGKTSTKYFTVKVNKALTNTSTISAENIKLGESITLNASANGGTAPYKYKYYCRPEGSKNWTALTGTTTATKLNKKPARAISYEFAVKAADSCGKTATKYFKIQVSK